ncbi:unnamed protein product (macronuclear) [Paramecium tetraurelia]|uniref:Transmembrane protein n=1 Tax=Paramecium tetraurelia TaxID=5888 RepID=A0DN78_PARTE|nr:uncharacterized protein GSPATT00018700001 [Paramecium tetraurelia]CAK84495.1 unnamed protein product [Paramecium tetraurelia]|eukprot:XP_001451892.1 hypothetical protein (macronuclear) [Paramecium tetraurelia strain d4-2]
MQFQQLSKSSPSKNSTQKKTIFHQEKQSQDGQEKEEKNEKAEIDTHTTRFAKQMRLMIHQQQNANLRESIANLKKRKTLEGFSGETPVSIQQCFSFLNSAIQNARSLRSLDLSGMEIDPLLAIELGQGLQKNSSLNEINLSGCKLNSFSLQYIFSSIANHQTLQSINLFNNQGFNIDLMNDINQFVFKGKNNLKKLKLTHCNISSTAMSYLLRNLKYSRSINAIDISMMQFTTDVLTTLGMALQHYKGKKVLEYLNIGDTNIRNQGVEVLAQVVGWNIRKINLKELNIRRNFINQKGVQHLELFLRKINNLQKLDLSQNQLEEFSCQNLLSRKMYEVNLSSNLISCFPQQFFLNTLVINLTNNNITNQGAFQLSSILRQNPLWIELNLSNNQIKSEGFNSLIFGLRDNKMLKKFIVANNNLDGEAIITYMINHEQVYFEHLDVSYNFIRYALIFFLLKFIKSGCLRCLRCSFQQKQQNEAWDINVNPTLFHEEEKITKSAQNQFQLISFNLRELDFSKNENIFTPVISSLATYFNKIEILDLSSCKPITEYDLDLLCTFLKKSTVVHDLNLRDLNIGSLNLESVKKLRNSILNSSLKKLNMSKNYLFKLAKAFQVEEIITNYKLESLDMSQNGIESRHTNYIEIVLSSYRNLQYLNLSHNNIGFTGLISISRVLQENKCIKSLNVSNQKMSADDLLILSSIISNENLQFLNISDNPGIKRLKTFFNLCQTEKMELLQLSQMHFDKPNFRNLINITKKQTRNILGISLNRCSFRLNDYEKFGNQLLKCKKLQMLSMTYNPLVYVDLNKTVAILNALPSLKILKLNQVTFSGETFCNFKDWILSPNNCSLITLDISENVLRQEWLDELCIGIGGNRTIQHLFLNKCNLGKYNLDPLGLAISKNSTIRRISIANNNIVDNLCSSKFAAVSQYNTISFEELNLSDNPLGEKELIRFFTPQIFKNRSKLVAIIKQLNLSNCKLQISFFQNLVKVHQIHKEQFLFSHIISLSLSSNQLDDSVGELLQQTIIQSTQLQELYLQQNLLTSKGMIQILEGIFATQTIKTINISSNNIGDEFAMKLDSLKNQKCSIEFLLLRDNNFQKQGLKILAQILSFQKNLFIDNIWSNLDDEDADNILEQYTRICQKYRLDQSSLPSFLKEIQLSKSNLTDKFCESFGKYYPLLGFIEFIDVSDNPCITMYGKVYLFFHLFDYSYEKHQLRALHISDTQETRKLFDDGLLRYLTLRVRNYLLRQTKQNLKKQHPLQQQNNSEKQTQKLFGGMLGSWLIHMVNKLMKYLDLIEPQIFIVSTLFIGKFRRNNINIKILVFLFWFGFVVVNISQFFKLFIQVKDKNQSSIFKGEQNRQITSAIYTDLTYTFIIVGTIVIIEILQLILTVALRRKIQPALQIIHPKMLEHLRARFPHKREIFLMIYSIFSKSSTLAERMFLASLMSLSDDIIDEKISKYQILFSIVIFARFADSFIITLINLIKFISATPSDDQAKYLSLLQRNLYYQNYFVSSDVLVTLCPVQGYQLTKTIKVNYEIIIETYRVFLMELILFIFIWSFSRSNHIVDLTTFIDPKWPTLRIWMAFLFIKCIISIIVSLFKILTVRPAVVKQNGFNQALAIKRFYQNKHQFVKPQNIQIEQNLQNIEFELRTKQQQQSQFSKELEQRREIKIQNKIQEIDQIEEEEQEILLSKQNSNIDQLNISSYSDLPYQDAPQSPLSNYLPKFKFNI